MKTYLFLIPIFAALSSMTGCTPTVYKRGNMVKDYQIEQIVPGVHTKTDVLKIMGSPTTQAPFDDRLWYYIGQQSEKRGILDPKVVEERIVTVKFGDDDTVISVDEIENERVNIPVAREKTPTQGHKLTPAQQIFGNLGKFNKQSTNQ